MPSFVVIESKKDDTDFSSEAKTILKAHKFTEVNPGTYMAYSGTSTTAAASKLKNLESYKKHRSSAGIKIYHGNLSS